jgi:hypothetical protein
VHPPSSIAQRGTSTRNRAAGPAENADANLAGNLAAKVAANVAAKVDAEAAVGFAGRLAAEVAAEMAAAAALKTGKIRLLNNRWDSRERMSQNRCRF